MTTGALIFAQNNAYIDYTKLAIFSARQIIKYLNIPVTLVTDNPDYLYLTYPEESKLFDKVIAISSNETQQKKFHDGSLSYKKYEWKNFSRNQAYDLTPYDTTLVIDSDYVINSKILSVALNSDYDFQIYKDSLDLAGWRDSSSFTRINQYSIPFYWATVFVFKKTPVTESFFKLIDHIKNNWDYYRILYSIDATNFRNDFAFSIAIHIMNDLTDGDFATPLPGTMVYCLDRDFLVSAEDNKIQFLVEKESYNGEYTLVKTTGLDVHVMNKQSLTRFIDGGTGV